MKRKKVYLTKRSIEPCKGLWHLPGGTVRFGESLTEAGKLTANKEASESGWLTKLPKEMHDEQRDFLKEKII